MTSPQIDEKETTNPRGQELTAKLRQNREISNANLKPWKPGQSGNPKGSPKKRLSLTMLAREMIEKDPSILEDIVKQWLKQGRGGDREARRDLQDRLEGKVTQPIRSDEPIVIKVVYEESNV